jgi:glycosyltransferase involved in cell wall biosynthesis
MTRSSNSLHPLISVVIETITARFDTRGSALADVLAAPIAALDGQTYPRDRIETIVVVDDGIDEAEIAAIARRHPRVVLVKSDASNYFAAKNRGAAAASGELIVFLDGDCVPESDCLERLADSFEPDVAVVAGRVLYSGGSWTARIFSVPDFAYILTRSDGQANGLNLSNAAFRRELIMRHPLDERLRRNGGCYQLFHRIRGAGARVLYQPAAVASHGIDVGGLGFLRKHFDRGYDGLAVYRFDDAGLFRGTAWVRRLGPIALAALTVRRILVDWARLARHRRQIGIPTAALPGYAIVAGARRGGGRAGALAASLRAAAARA